MATNASGSSALKNVQGMTGICYEFEGEETCTNRIVLSRAEPLCDDLE